MGYDKDEDGKLVINEEEAEIVRRIFEEYLRVKAVTRLQKAFLEIASLQQRVEGSGVNQQSERCCKTRNIVGMHFYKKLCNCTFLLRYI